MSVSDEYKIPTSANAPANVTLVGGQQSSSMSPEIDRCVSAYLAAFDRASSQSRFSTDACFYVAKLAFEAQLQIEMTLMSKLANPRGLVS